MTPLPQEVVDRARCLAEVHNLKTVAMIMGKQPSQITEMKQRGWKAADLTAYRRPMPADFAIQSRHMGIDRLAAHYRAGKTSVTRWLKELREGQRG